MVVRKRKRRNKLLGQRTRGKGDTKNVRGAGSRGGRGLAGSHKHKFSKYYGKFGTEKKQVKPKYAIKAINIDQLLQLMPRLLAEGKVAKENDMLIVDGKKAGFDKLLSRGSIKEKISFKNVRVSKKAVEKVKAAGGDVEEAFEKEEDAEAEGKKAEDAKEVIGKEKQEKDKEGKKLGKEKESKEKQGKEKLPEKKAIKGKEKK